MNKSKKYLKSAKRLEEPQKAESYTKKRFGLWNIQFYPLLFLLLWLFCSVIYGDVFYMSQQTSYFAWDKTLMSFILSQDWGGLYAAGRFLLLGFHYPLLGGCLLALMLTLCAWLIDYLAALPAKLRLLAALPLFAFLAYFVGLDYSVNYHRETSLLMALPFAALLLLLLASVIKRIVIRKKISSPLKLNVGTHRNVLINNLGVCCVFLCISAFCFFQRDDLIRTCRMTKMLEQSDWQAMIDEALGARRPSRSVAAYYAIALAETGLLESRAFEIPYDYPNRKVREKDGRMTDGISIYTLDADFYAGLANTSYHNCMEIAVTNGPQIFLLKRMTRAAAMNGEKRLAWKYITMIDRNPFEHKFVERYKNYLANLGAMYAEPEFVHVVNKKPVYDDFEQNYRTPLFLGYNVVLTQGASQEALNVSLMATLYSKDLDAFMAKVHFLDMSQPLPEYYSQAVMLRALKDKSILKYFPSINGEMTRARLMGFVKEAKPYLRDEKDEGRKLLSKDWQNYYPYYLYFENIPTEEQVEEQEKQEKGGVN